MKEKIYIINGVEYKSLDEIPQDLKKFVAPSVIEKIIKEKSGKYQTIKISPVLGNNLEFKSMKWILYIASHAISLAENQALRIMAIAFKIVDINIFLSLIFSFLIGQISYFLAKKYYLKQMGNVEFLSDLNFFKIFAISQISAGYSFVFNLLVFFFLFLLKHI